MAKPLLRRGPQQSHFGAKRLELVSGFRSPPHPNALRSYHEVGQADIHIAGVPNEKVYAYCLTLENVGCGYYPNGMHVHIDVRSRNSHWTDVSAYGEPAICVSD